MRIYFTTVCIALLLSSCATTDEALTHFDGPLGSYKNLYLEVADGSRRKRWGITDVTTNSTARERKVGHVIRATQRQVSDLGFTFVASPDEADLILVVHIDRLVFDPIAGWITDHFALEFSRPKDRLEIARVTISNSIAPPRIDSSVKKAVARVREEL